MLFRSNKVNGMTSRPIKAAIFLRFGKKSEVITNLISTRFLPRLILGLAILQLLRIQHKNQLRAALPMILENQLPSGIILIAKINLSPVSIATTPKMEKNSESGM